MDPEQIGRNRKVIVPGGYMSKHFVGGAAYFAFHVPIRDGKLVRVYLVVACGHV